MDRCDVSNRKWENSNLTRWTICASLKYWVMRCLSRGIWVGSLIGDSLELSLYGRRVHESVKRRHNMRNEKME